MNEWYLKNIESITNKAKNHNSLPYVKLMTSIRNKKRRIENHKIVSEIEKKYRKSHKEKILITKRKYRDINKEKINIKLKKWRNSPTGIISVKTYSAKRLAQQKGLTKALVQLVYERNSAQHGRLTCYLCLVPVAWEKSHLEHKIPLNPKNKEIIPGTNNIDNLDVACASCNHKKNNKTEEEYRSSLIGASA